MSEQTQVQTPTPQPAPTTTQPDGGQQSAAAQSGKQFTQEQLDAIIADRLARERSKYADYDELKKAKEQLDNASKTEIEKATERALKAEARQKEVEQSARLAELRANATTKAVELGFDGKRIDKVLRLVDIDADKTPEQVAASLEALAKEMPELLTKSKASSVGATNPPKGSESATTETDAQKRARIFGGGSFGDWTKQGGIVYYPKDGAPK